ncbi:hypothetical protein [Verrucomicrobium spinosum]|uniref:hypothetical protein n=1 Tax=Verrucomicrobium spinosum TaxID=2736 RepID=UPI0001744C28|nr:hypothetical protein [Verrucomicrobium spinosum]
MDPGILGLSLIGPFDDGTKQLRDASNFHIFHRRDANVPTLEKAGWLLGEFIRHGLIPPELKDVAAQASAACWRTDLYHRALKKTPSKKTQNARAKTRATPSTIRKPRRAHASAPASVTA